MTFEKLENIYFFVSFNRNQVVVFVPFHLASNKCNEHALFYENSNSAVCLFLFKYLLIIRN